MILLHHVWSSHKTNALGGPECGVRTNLKPGVTLPFRTDRMMSVCLRTDEFVHKLVYPSVVGPNHLIGQKRLLLQLAEH